MLVRDMGDAWQLVLQQDHADLSGAFAEAWGGDGFAPPAPTESMQLASFRHDDGWGVWDRRPGWNPEKSQPRTFLDVPVPVHLAFYRACIAAVTQEDPYAGMMISMHGAGIYNGRYGTQPSLGLSDAERHRAEVDRFVAEQEEVFAGLAADLSVDEAERWTNYKLLQMYDRLSLYFCLKDLEGGEADEIGPAPRRADEDVALSIEPVGPWRVRMTPFPFAESPARFALVRRVMPKRAYAGNADFRADFAATPPETVEIAVEGP